MMRRVLSTILELVGYGLVVGAAFLVDLRLGLLVAGVALVVVAYGLAKR